MKPLGLSDQCTPNNECEVESTDMEVFPDMFHLITIIIKVHKRDKKDIRAYMNEEPGNLRSLITSCN